MFDSFAGYFVLRTKIIAPRNAVEETVVFTGLSWEGGEGWGTVQPSGLS